VRVIVKRLLFLNPDYTVARYPDAANGVPYELYDQCPFWTGRAGFFRTST